MTNWLVIWNIFLFSTKKKWDNHSNWRTHIFQDGKSTTNQLRVWYRLLWKPWPMAGDAPLPGTTPSSNSKHSNEPKPNDGGGNSNVDLLDLWNYVRYVLCKLCLFLLKKTIWLYDFICVDFFHDMSTLDEFYLVLHLLNILSCSTYVTICCSL